MTQTPSGASTTTPMGQPLQFFHTAKGQRVAWYLYDFGNSAYAAVILLAVYSAYFKQGVVGGAQGIKLWGIAVAIAMIVSALIAPILGALADYRAMRKKFLAFFTVQSCLFTASLFFVHKGDVALGMILFVMAEIGYRSGQVFYNGLLPSISTPQTVGRVSGTGWAIGSLGGMLCLFIVLPIVVLIGGDLALRSTFIITALYFAVATMPLFFYVPEPGIVNPLPVGKNIWTIGFIQIGERLKKARHHLQYLKFLLAFILFNDGVMIALNFAAIIGAVLHGFTQQQMIILIILVQATNMVGAWLFGILSDRWGAKPTLLGAIILMIMIVGWMMINQSNLAFYAIGGMAGFAMAGLQAVSRTMVVKLSPAENSAEFFGLFAVAGRSSSFIGPALFGWSAAMLAGQYITSGMDAGAAEQTGLRWASLLIIAFLAVGGAILFTVKESERKPGR